MTRKNSSTWSIEERRRALFACAYHSWNLSAASRQSGVPVSTLKRWVDALDADARQEYESRLNEGLEPRLQRIVEKYADRLEREVETMPKNMIAHAMGVTFDKLRTLRGQPSDINGMQYLEAPKTAEELAAAINEIFSAATPKPAEDAASGSVPQRPAGTASEGTTAD